MRHLWMRLSPKKAKQAELESENPFGIPQLLHINFDNTLISLIWNRSALKKRIVWKGSSTQGIDQSKLYQGSSTWEKRRSHLGLDGFPTCWENKLVTHYDPAWKLDFRSGTYILCNALSKEISETIDKAIENKGEILHHQWDEAIGAKGTAKCLNRLSFMPGPCEIGQSAPIAIFSHSALLRSLTDTFARITPLPKYITRIIVEFAFLGDCAPRF